MPGREDLVEVSAIIPCRDGATWLPDAIRSTFEQGVSRLETIVVDDGSEVPCADVATQTRPEAIVLRHEEPRGPAAARNTGLRAARGAFIAFLDADDVWQPGGIARHLERLAAHPEALFSVAATEIVVMPATRGTDIVAGRVLRKATVDLLLPATVFRREAFTVVGVLDEALRFGEDSDWFLRARERGVPYITHAERYLFYRRHERNMTCGRDLRELFVPQTIVRSLRRRRAEGDLKAIPPIPEPGDA